jgi:hypothetical protein
MLPGDELGVKALTYSIIERLVYPSVCLMLAPSREGVEKHHENIGSSVIGLQQ